MGAINISSWVRILALFASFGCGTACYYRLHRDRTARAWLVLSFTLGTFTALVFYLVHINPYPQPLMVARVFSGLALLLLLIGIVLLLLAPNSANRRLSLAQIRTLLPDSVRDLKPEQMRELLPPRFHAHGLHEIQALIMAQLSEMPPGALRALSPEKLRGALRHAIPRSILDQ